MPVALSSQSNSSKHGAPVLSITQRHSHTYTHTMHDGAWFQLTSWKRRDGLEAALCQSSDHLESTKLSMQSANNFPCVVENSLCAFFHQFFSAYYFILSNTPNTKCPLSNLIAQRSHRERRRPPRGPAARGPIFDSAY